MKSQRALGLIAVICSAFLCSCTAKNDNLTISDRQTLKGLPSASGTAILDNTLYVIGDDSPWIYKLNSNFQIASRIPFRKYQLNAEGVIPKPQKPDLEALTPFVSGDSTGLLAFSSGSLSPQRDSLVYLDSQQPQTPQIYSLQRIYNELKSHAKLQGHELNIEAAAIADDELFIFNRDNNLVFRYDLYPFLRFVFTKGNVPNPTVYQLVLPEIEGIEAGFSGATHYPSSGKIIFTASVEDTPNAIDDGKILGSFAGIIDIEKLSDQYHPESYRISEDDKPLKLKVESVSVLNKLENEIDIILVTDSDGGNSQIIQASMRDILQ